MAKRTTKAKTATAPATPAASQFKAGDLVEFYCPEARKRIQEEVIGHVPEHGYVTVESKRHFPEKELSLVEE